MRTTPQLLQAGQYAAFGAALLLMLTVILGARSHRHAMQAIGRDSAPSIIAAQHIRAALADMDANAANELLDERTATASRKVYEDRRREAVESIVTAAQNITYGDAELIPVRKLAYGLGTYTALMQRARDLHEAGDKRFIGEWRTAAQYMDNTVLPAAADLDKANRQVLDDMYAAQGRASSLSIVLTLLTAALLLAVLFWLQWFLMERTRRTLNPLLVGASVVAVFFVVYTLAAFRAQDHHLKVAKEDAFESIHALWQARSLSYSANSDESRYLLDRDQADVFQNAFFVKAYKIAHLPKETSRSTAISMAGQGTRIANFTGYLADELNNITFDGEREAAAATLARYLGYMDIDGSIRSIERSGKHAEAVALCTGSKEGESNWAFDRFDTSLGKTLDVNQKAFDNAVAAGFQDVYGFEIVAPVAALAIAALTFLGLKPRLREYLNP